MLTVCNQSDKKTTRLILIAYNFGAYLKLATSKVGTFEVPKFPIIFVKEIPRNFQAENSNSAKNSFGTPEMCFLVQFCALITMRIISIPTLRSDILDFRA